MSDRDSDDGATSAAQDPAGGSEIDFDDESPEEFLPMDEREAKEAGVDLDDPEETTEDDDAP